MATDERLRLLIDARNNASGSLRQVKNDLSGIEGAAKLLSGGLGGVFGALGVASVAGLGMAAVQLGKVGAAALEMRASFDNLAQGAGLSGQAILAAMRTASEGMVADTELIAGANRALMMKAADSAQEMAALMEVAKVRSDAVGMGVGEAFATLAEGIGKVSERGLYALGIQLDLEKVNTDYAASLGKTAAALSENEKRQALYNAVIADSAQMVASAAGLSDADRIDQAAAAWANLKVEIGAALSPAIAEAASFLADSMERMRAGNKLGGAAFGLEDVQMLEIYQDKLQALNDQLAAGIPLTAAEMESRRALAEALEQNGFAVDGVASSTERLKDDQYAALPAVDALSGGFRRQVDELNAIQSSMRGMRASIQSAMAGLAADIGVGRAWQEGERLNAELQRRTDIMEQYGMSAERIEFENAAWKATQIDLLQDEVAAQDALTRAATRTSAAVGDLSGEYDDLKGRVSGVLQSALGDVGGADVSKFLPREDAVAENARRLAAIMNEGLAGQDWLGEFAAEVPDLYQALVDSGDPQGAAAKVLQEFQAGLRPELLDKERAKELVRQAIVGEQNMAALADEISGELAAELGVTVARARAAAAGVMGAHTGVRETLEGVSTGLDGSAEGERFAAEVTAAAAALPAQMYTAGVAAGGEWSAGLEAGMESVSPKLDMSGVDGAAAGVQFAGDFAAALAPLEGTMYAAGQGAGSQWGVGFSEGIVDGADLSPILLLSDPMYAAGQSAGAQWGVGFAEGVIDDADLSPLLSLSEPMYAAGQGAGSQWGAGFAEGIGGAGLTLEGAYAALEAQAQGIMASLTAALSGDESNIGAELARAIGMGFEADTTAADNLVAQFTSPGMAGQMRSAGERAAGTWGGAFADAVARDTAPQVIQMLVTLVTPGVLAAVQAQQTQTRAR